MADATPDPQPATSHQSAGLIASVPTQSVSSQQQPAGSGPAQSAQPVHNVTDEADTAASGGADAAGATTENILAIMPADPAPTDADYVAFENDLRAQQQLRPLLGPLQPLTDLEVDYAGGSQIFVSKIQSLKKSFASLRRTRQDGNCFYRSFWFGLLEALIVRKDRTEVDRLIKCLEDWKPKLIAIGFQELVFEDALDAVLGLLNQICPTGAQAEALAVPELEIRMADENLTAYMIMLIRLITSAEIQRRQDHFYPFIMGMSDEPIGLEDFCRRQVEAMGEESDNIQLVAVADAFEVHVRVVYLDNSTEGSQGDELTCTILDFKPDHGSAAPPVHVLYRPGHYDILYPA